MPRFAIIIPDMETSFRITWMIDGLLCESHALPTGLTIVLRAYKSELENSLADEKWARPGQSARYGKVADLIAQRIAGEEWKPGEMMPSAKSLAGSYKARDRTVIRALHVLAARGVIAMERHAYYVMPYSTSSRGTLGKGMAEEQPQ
jgi:hypothetical protein